MCVSIVYLTSERDWEDIKKMPEYNTLMKDFNSQGLAMKPGHRAVAILVYTGPGLSSRPALTSDDTAIVWCTVLTAMHSLILPSIHLQVC